MCVCVCVCLAVTVATYQMQMCNALIFNTLHVQKKRLIATLFNVGKQFVNNDVADLQTIHLHITHGLDPWRIPHALPHTVAM